MEEIKNKYDALLIDAVNLSHRLYKKEDPQLVTKKLVYKDFIKNFINTVEDLKRKYLYSDGKVYLLFDNYFSRADLQNSFIYAARKSIDEDYKKRRSKAEKEFYNSINLIRYYYLIGKPDYITIRIEGLEADDLVKPLIQSDLKDKSYLMVTTDLDWCRYLTQTGHWLPNLSEDPETSSDLAFKLGFPINEKNIICYKALFGDSSDNIPETVRKTQENIRTFCNIIKNIKYPEQFIKEARENPTKNKLFTDLIGNERQFTINLQLVSTIPCGNSVFRENVIKGRNAESLYNSLREILGLNGQKSFVFGNVKRPRV